MSTSYTNRSGQEYSGLIPSGGACSYTKLSAYNTSFPYGSMAPVPATQVLANTRIVVPAFGSFGYNSLTHGVSSSCGPYFNRNDAYPGMDAKGQCTATKYISRACM